MTEKLFDGLLELKVQGELGSVNTPKTAGYRSLAKTIGSAFNFHELNESHVKTRLKTLRGEYTVLAKILATSGQGGMDETTWTINASNEFWNTIVCEFYHLCSCL